MGVSTMTAFRDLNELVERKLIVLRGGGRSTYYMLKNEVPEEVTLSEARRPHVVKVISDAGETVDNTDSYSDNNY